MLSRNQVKFYLCSNSALSTSSLVLTIMNNKTGEPCIYFHWTVTVHVIRMINDVEKRESYIS